MGQFPLLTLQDILFSKSFVDKKGEIYINQCKKHNIVWIEGITAEFHRIFTTAKIDIRAKIHALFLLKEIIKTCQYSVLILVETYLLGFLTDIAEYYSKNPSLQKNSKYFESLGYSPSYPNIEQLSHNYVMMGFQILYTCGMIRPKQNFQGQELRKDSSFWTALIKIKDKNHKIFNETQLKKKLFIPELRENYKQQLSEFQSHSYFYIDHYMKKLQDFIFVTKLNHEVEVLDFRILLKKGDSYLTSEAVARLAEMIDFVDEFNIKARALALLNQMILWGDIEAVITVNYTEYFEKIFRQFFKIDGSKGLKKGQEIFRDIKSQSQDKKKFYCDFLRCLQIWAESFPHEYMIFYDKEENEFASPIFKNYRFLKEVRKFIFPENPFLDKMKAETRQKFKENSERNKKIIDQLNKEINEVQDVERVSFDQINKKMQISQRYLKKLKQNTVEGTVESMMKHLIKFENSFELELQRLTQNVDDTILDHTIEMGLLCIEIIGLIEPEYDRFKRGKITLKDFIYFCTKKIDFSKKCLNEINLNSSRSIQDRKSSLKSSITSRVDKSTSTIKNMTEQTRIRIIKSRYLERLQKMANRTSSQKDDSFLNTSRFLNKRTSQSFSKIPLESAKRIELKSPQNIREVKSIHKVNHNVRKSPRQTGKKVFLVSKYFESKPSQQLENIKNQIIQENWNSNKKINLKYDNPKEPSFVQKNTHFSFVDQTIPSSQNQQNTKNPIKQSKQAYQKLKEKKSFDFIKIVDQIESRSPQSSDLHQSPKFGNTEIREETKKDSSNENKKRFRRGVGLAKQFVNLTQKLIGPQKQTITFQDFEQCFPYKKSTQEKKEIVSKQMTILQNEIFQVDRVTVSSEHKLRITFYLFPKENCERIRLKIFETPSIYLNVSENKDVRIQRSNYELKNLKYGQQYEFQITGSVVKAPIMMPRIQIRVNQEKSDNFMIPFPLMHMMKFKKVQSKWLGKDFDLADKIVSEEFTRNKDMLGSLCDIDDYMEELTEVKGDKNVKKYRTQCRIEKTSFVLEVKEVQNRMSLQACPLGQNYDRSIIEFYIAEFMNLFS